MQTRSCFSGTPTGNLSLEGPPQHLAHQRHLKQIVIVGETAASSAEGLCGREVWRGGDVITDVL